MTDARLAWICRLAVVAAIVGVLGTWRNSGATSLNGLEGPHDGWLAILFALVALAGIGSLRRGGWAGIVLVAGCSVGLLVVPLRNLLDDRDVLAGTAGWGIWLTIAAGAALGVAAVVAALARTGRVPLSRPA